MSSGSPVRAAVPAAHSSSPAASVYQAHGFRDLIRDLVREKDCRKMLLDAAGVSEADGNRRIPWNNTSLRHLRPCWSILVHLGLVEQAIIDGVNCSSGKVNLPARVDAIHPDRLRAGTLCVLQHSVTLFCAESSTACAHLFVQR